MPRGNRLSWEIAIMPLISFAVEVVKASEINSPRTEVSRPTPRQTQGPREQDFQVQEC